MLAAHGALLSDERLPLVVTDLREMAHIEGRVLGHGQEEFTDRMYLMIEGVDGRVHFIHPLWYGLPSCTSSSEAYSAFTPPVARGHEELATWLSGDYHDRTFAG